MSSYWSAFFKPDLFIYRELTLFFIRSYFFIFDDYPISTSIFRLRIKKSGV